MKKSNLIRPVTFQNHNTIESWFNYAVCNHILIPATNERTQKGQYEYTIKIQLKCMICEKMYTLRIAAN